MTLKNVEKGMKGGRKEGEEENRRKRKKTNIGLHKVCKA